MTMTRLKISKTLLAVMLTSAVATGSAYAENNAQTTNESAGQKVDSSMNKVGNRYLCQNRSKSRDPERFR